MCECVTACKYVCVDAYVLMHTYAVCACEYAGKHKRKGAARNRRENGHDADLLIYSLNLSKVIVRNRLHGTVGTVQPENKKINE